MGKEQDDRIQIGQLITAGGPTMKTRGQAALNGTEADRHAFLMTGQYAAAEIDDRIKVGQIMSAGGPEVKSAAQVALEGSRAFLKDFLTDGQFRAQRRDLEAVTHVARVRGLVAEAAGYAANARKDAAEAARVAAVARKAAEDAARYAQEAQQAANQAAGYATQALQSAQAAAASAIQAAQSAQIAKAAAASARQSARNAAASAAQANDAAARASSYASAAYDAADRARASALAAGRSADQAAAEASAALAAAVALQRQEAAQSPGGPPEGPRLDQPTGEDPRRLGNQLLGNNALAQAALALWGGNCFTGAKQIICTDVDTPNGRPITVGDYLLYPDSRRIFDELLEDETAERARLRAAGVDASTYGPDLLEHEARHSDQWQYLPPTQFLTLYYLGTAASYLLTGTDGDGNPWEIGANPYKGAYWTYGKPIIDWSKCWIIVWC